MNDKNGGMLVVIACGKAKASRTTPASAFYIGSYFKACRDYARSIASNHSILILSAKYGLVGLEDPLSPYDIKMGDPGSITTASIAGQWLARRLAPSSLLSLCPVAYNHALVDFVRVPIWTPFPFRRPCPIGTRCSYLRKIRGHIVRYPLLEAN